jgi:hypothetical protein
MVNLGWEWNAAVEDGVREPEKILPATSIGMRML